MPLFAVTIIETDSDHDIPINREKGLSPYSGKDRANMANDRKPLFAVFTIGFLHGTGSNVWRRGRALPIPRVQRHFTAPACHDST
jgi:hypothetical protein